MSTAQTPQPEETAGTPATARAAGAPAPATPGAPPPSGARGGLRAALTARTADGRPDRPAPSLWARRVTAGAVLGGLAWGVTALLSPDTALVRQSATAVLCAAAAVIVQHVLGLDRRVEEHARHTRSLLTETANALRGGLDRHDEELRTGLARQSEELRGGLDRHDEELRTGLARQSEELRGGLDRQSEELRAGLTRHAENIRQLVETRFAEVERSAEPYPGPERVRIDSVPELAKSFAEVLAPQPPILYTFVRLEMKRVVGHMTDLTNLSAECPGENHDWMLSLTRAAEQSVCATSTSVDREFWNSEPASRYLQAQHEAIEERGVSVRRVFLLESARELDDRLLRLCEEQELLRIEVRVAVLPELPPHLQRGTTNDFIVYDEEASFEIDQDLRDVNVRTRLIARQDHVQDRMKRFRELWDAGMGVRELEVRVDDEEDGTWMVDRG
ncbi:hypothetical protein [Streptomyces sp. NPDC018610]|uniref:hypothetical protein n=1 Tax=Streptomyces sp. NPDC018610 TaxID=3365049 RepID=UPI0037ABF8AA